MVGPTKRGKGTKLLGLAEGAGTPLGVPVEAASPAEGTLLEPTVDSLPENCGQPERLIADRGYDSNAARAWLAERGIAPIIPARSNNTVATHRDGRTLRRYKRRWLLERRIAWLQHFRRLVVRYEYLAVHFIALVHLACAVITLKRV